ncbi:MAG: hypothetical protein K0R38_4812, partial [Polyangiaceae bacterium]|nr:hypothetical protein [Polyangiaceae bacterium]
MRVVLGVCCAALVACGKGHGSA